MNRIEICDNFEIEDLGIQEEWVYDIEVDQNHNFFGNNILVHNSVYYHIEPFMEMYQAKNPGLNIDSYVDWADQFEIKVIQPVVDKCIADFSRELNAFNPGAIGAEREIISDSAVFTAKKKYYARVRDSEGTRFPEDDPYIKVMGLEIIKSTTPAFSKKKLKEAIPHILDKNEIDLRAWVNAAKAEFKAEPLNNIAAVSGVSKVVYDPTDLDKNGKAKSLNIGTRSAIAYNDYINEHKLTDKYVPMMPGDKARRLFLIEPNPFDSPIVSFLNESFIDEIGDYIDYDKNFQKNFLQPLMIMVDCMGWDMEKETAELDDW
jgi:hypothetical protein